MHTVNIHDAKTHLSAILKRVESGEDVLIAKAGKPIARVSPVTASLGKRQPGSAKGAIVFNESFLKPLPKSILKGFEK
ncbi:MAG: type II toxin-antitoxin system Phd/YefM family antitoxin [Deltaproteobacteria bacterium]|nr:type II toxin-antitoxin system Phd/YefM family antitoxin [Deltaproteobacteria bacterium]